MTDLFKDPPNVFTVPAGGDFLGALTRGLEAIEKEFSLEPPDITLFLPTARSIRAFQAHQMERLEGKATLLPHLRPLGGVDEDDILLESLIASGRELELPPAITPLKRTFLLLKELEKFAGARGFEDLSERQRLDLAWELGRLLDQMQNAGLKKASLKNLVPENLAGHWQKILSFLEVILEDWPKKLKKLGLMDPVERRVLLIRHQIKIWKSDPPKTPVIAAGSTGSVPATRELLKTIASLPQGAVILPGFDQNIDLGDWEAVFETHPQHMMKQTLESFGLARDKVRTWPFVEDSGEAIKTRLEFFKKALKPSPTTSSWHHLKFDRKKVARSFDVIEAQGVREEAAIIALILRETLENKGKTAALVTPDRDLARRVRAELKRWNLEVGDSAGQKLLNTPPGAFFMLLAEMVDARFSPTHLLSFLKNPLSTGGLERKELLGLARRLDKEVLRGPLTGAGLDQLKNLVLAGSLENKKTFLKFIDGLNRQTSGLQKDLKKKSVSFSKILESHLQAAAALSKTREKEAIWQGPEGEALAAFLSRMVEEGASLGTISGADYPGILKGLLEREVVRRPFGNHPRLSILGALEARILKPDLVILGSLNEGTWPPSAQADPWMNQDMRKVLGLPTPEQRIGQSAHDFFMTLGAGEVIMTRAAKVEGTPETPSRWLQRAGALLGGKLPGTKKTWAAWAAMIDHPDSFEELAPPKPKPPAEARPKKLSVTNIEKLIRDPYSVYAKYVLGLEPLDELEATPGAADRGLILHRIFEVFFEENNFRLPKEPLEKLEKTGRKIFAETGLLRPAVRAFWWPRFLETAEAFITEQKTREKDFEMLGVEIRGKLKLKTKTPFTLTAKADRIDRLKRDGGYWIIDYKSGGLPYKSHLKDGTRPQLPLEGLMLAEGGFEKFGKGRVAGLEFWNIGKPGPKIETQKAEEELEEIIREARTGIEALVDHFGDEKNPYLAVPDPSANRYGDYDPLSRYREWQNKKPGKKDRPS